VPDPLLHALLVFDIICVCGSCAIIHHHHLFHIPAILRGYNHSTMGYGISHLHTISFTSI